MADFAPNYTARYVIRYSVLGFEHTMQFRIGRSAGLTGLVGMTSKVTNFLATLESLMFTDWTILDAKYSAEDTSFFVPVAAPTQPAGSITIPAQFASQAILSTSFVGLSNQGHKARMFVYGLNIGPENTAFTSSDDFRITGTDTADIGNAIAILNTGSPPTKANDDNDVTWYDYVNTKNNDFHLRATRG